MCKVSTIDSANAEATVPLPTTVIEPTSGWRLVNLGELWRYRELLFFFTWRDIKVRYKQTVLGAAWAVLQPVMTMIVFTIFFGKLGRLEEFADAPYPIFVFAALVPWSFFGQAVAAGGLSLISGSNLISKVYFPRLIIPFASAGGLLVDFVICFVVMAIMMVYYQVAPTLNLLMVPVLTLATICAALGAGSFLAALAVAYRDVRHVIPFLMQIWLFASPVAYPFKVIPDRWKLVYALNPMAGIISGFRSAMLGEAFFWGPISVSLFVSVVMLVGGAFYFRRIERRFADIV